MITVQSTFLETELSFEEFLCFAMVRKIGGAMALVKDKSFKMAKLIIPPTDIRGIRRFEIY